MEVRLKYLSWRPHDLLQQFEYLECMQKYFVGLLAEIQDVQIEQLELHHHLRGHQQYCR